MTPVHYKLPAGQYISDLNLQINPLHYVTHLCADTGMGKSSWVMETLCQQGPIIFAVPQRAQITQLQAKYGDRGDVEFIYGGHTALSDTSANIVCTYDQLPALQARLFCRNYTLVVDEVHKLYQAASYRGEAISGLLDVIQEGRFNRVVTLSATFNRELVPYLIDSWLEVSRIETVERHVALHLYVDKDAAAKDVLAGLESGSAPTIIRINDKEAMAAYRKMLEARGLTCLCVNRDVQATDEVVEMLTDESVAQYDVVLTTSLLDEAVNIQDQQIAELIVLNGKIHPEELKQFMGRFRQCNPPVRICLPHYMLGKQARALKAARQSAQVVINASRQIAEQILYECDALATVRKANGTLSGWFGFEPLRMKQGKVAANEAGMMASLYRADLNQCYQSEVALEQAMRRELKTLNWSVLDWDECPAEARDKALDQAVEQIGEDRTKALERCRQAMAESVAQHKRESNDPVNTVECLQALVNRCEHGTQEKVLASLWLELHQQVLIDPWDAFDALSQQQDRPIWHFHNTLHSNLFLKPVLQHLSTLPMGTVMTLAEARRHILEGLRQANRQYPALKELIPASNLKGVKVKRNNHFEVTDRFVRMIFREFTATPPVRSNNKDKIVFDGLGPFGYRYRLVHGEAPREGRKRTIRRIKPKIKAT
ncbi:hypothetical protein GCM10009104_23750 [Marinobacterium maritimum]|uniref:Helicase ATP-binding domain-containing protein n=1 Tax=Marinobacterium maritimum TaxID=500162 RepID=A0ABN1I7N3_9GAMM